MAQPVPAVLRVIWEQNDQVWSIASRYFKRSGYGSMSAFRDDILAKNPQVINWWDVAPGSIILVPMQSAFGTR
jgi:hypothetical protein